LTPKLAVARTQQNAATDDHAIVLSALFAVLAGLLMTRRLPIFNSPVMEVRPVKPRDSLRLCGALISEI